MGNKLCIKLYLYSKHEMDTKKEFCLSGVQERRIVIDILYYYSIYTIENNPWQLTTLAKADWVYRWEKSLSGTSKWIKL